MSGPPALVITAPGTNRDGEAAFALEQAGASVEVVSLAALAEQPRRLQQARLVAVAGGFSYGDALGSGRLFALEADAALGEGLREFVAAGRPVIGICNGFQMLIRSGLLVGPDAPLMLDHNQSGHFECRWVQLDAPSSQCVWTQNLDELLLAPVAHGEGRLRADAASLDLLERNGQVALRYAASSGVMAKGEYPANPNGSDHDIAGICDPSGLVLGLMPHPEDHVITRQHPQRTRGSTHGNCLRLFQNGVDHARTL